MAALKKLATLKQIAIETGVPYTSLRSAALRGLFPIIRFDRTLRAERDDVARFIEQHKEVSA